MARLKVAVPLFVLLLSATVAFAELPDGVGGVNIGAKLDDLLEEHDSQIQESKYSSPFFLAGARCGIRRFSVRHETYSKLSFITANGSVVFIEALAPVPAGNPRPIAERFVSKYGSPREISCGIETKRHLKDCGEAESIFLYFGKSSSEPSRNPKVRAVEVSIQSRASRPRYWMKIEEGWDHHYDRVMTSECHSQELARIERERVEEISIPD